MKTIYFYQTADGKTPFKKWLDRLRDKALLRKINERIIGFEKGYLADFASVGNGVMESRIHSHGGIRIYFLAHKDAIIILLQGGNKKTQSRDIAKAQEYAEDFRRRYE
jgi:putative addiction module killer protein